MDQDPISPNLTHIDLAKLDQLLDFLEAKLGSLTAADMDEHPELNALRQRMDRLLVRLENAQLVLGDRLLNQCLSAYVSLKAAGHGSELDAAYQDMCAEQSWH